MERAKKSYLKRSRIFRNHLNNKNLKFDNKNYFLDIALLHFDNKK
jgi:hypothetical protein